MQTTYKIALVLALIVVPSVARADTDAFGNPLPPVNRTLFALTLPVPIAFATRASVTNGGAATTLLGAIEARSYFGHQGFLLATGFIDSPRSAFADAAWSFADFSSRRMRGFHGGVSFDAGPSIGYVSATYVATNAQNAPTASPVLDVGSHATIGARVSAHVDLFIGPVMIGLVLGYRGGVPTNASSKDSFEGIFFFNAEVGGGFVR